MFLCSLLPWADLEVLVTGTLIPFSLLGCCINFLQVFPVFLFLKHKMLHTTVYLTLILIICISTSFSRHTGLGINLKYKFLHLDFHVWNIVSNSRWFL